MCVCQCVFATCCLSSAATIKRDMCWLGRQTPPTLSLIVQIAKPSIRIGYGSVSPPHSPVTHTDDEEQTSHTSTCCRSTILVRVFLTGMWSQFHDDWDVQRSFLVFKCTSTFRKNVTSCSGTPLAFGLSGVRGLKKPTAPSLHPSSSSSVFKHSTGVQTHYKIS